MLQKKGTTMLAYKYCKVLENTDMVMENILYWWAFLYYQPCKFEADIKVHTTESYWGSEPAH